MIYHHRHQHHHCCNQFALGMDMLQDEFLHILASNNVPLDIYQVYGSIRRGSMSLGGSKTGFEDNFNSYREEFDRSRSDRMIRARYEKECCQVYSNVRRDVLDECLAILGVEKLSIEEVQRIEWKVFDEKMKKWIQTVKVVVRTDTNGSIRKVRKFAKLLDQHWLCRNKNTDKELAHHVRYYTPHSNVGVFTPYPFKAMFSEIVGKVYNILHDILARIKVGDV
ncbi:exocyst complex component EXO70B1-like protein [Tanacetum coccineum]